MKKIILFLALSFAATYFSFGQNISPEKPIPTNPPIMLMPQQSNCMVPPVVVNVTQNNNALSIPPAKNGFLVNKKTSGTHHYCPYQYSNRWDNTYWNLPGKGLISTPPNSSISNSFNTTNNYYMQPTKEKDSCNTCGGYVYHWYNDNDWIVTLLLFGLIGAFLIWLANHLRNQRNNDNQSASNVTHTHTHTHKHEHTFPSTPPKAGDEKRKAPVTPAVDVAKLLEGLKDTGATATFFADGGFRVEMPKPPIKEEKKPEVKAEQ